MADLTVSADVDAMMSSANNAAILSNIGAASLTANQTFSGDQSMSGKLTNTSSEVTFSGIPKVSAYKSSNQTGLTTGAWNKITYDTEVYDVNGNFSSSTFTAPYACKVMVTVGAYFQTSSTNSLAVFKNGSEHKRLSRLNNSSEEMQGGTCIIDCATSDTLDIHVFPSAGITVTGGSAVNWVMFTVIP